MSVHVVKEECLKVYLYICMCMDEDPLSFLAHVPTKYNVMLMVREWYLIESFPNNT